MTTSGFARISPPAILAVSLTLLLLFFAGVPTDSLLLTPWSTVGFLALGSVLWSKQLAKPVPAVQWCGSAIVLLIGLVTSTEHMFNLNPGFDRLLFPASLSNTALHPGRPGPLMSLHFCLAGIALFLFGTRRTIPAAIRESVTVVAGTLSYFGTIGFFLGRTEQGLFASMSPLSGLLAMLGCTAILVSAPGGLLVPLLRDSGPAGLIARRLTPVPLVFPVMTMLLRATLRRLGVPESPAAGSIYTAVDVLAAFAILWFSGLKVLTVDTMRRQAEDELRRSRDDLDVRVQLRTSELTEANRQLAVEVINRQRAQAEVQQTIAMLNSLIEACPLAICAFNLDGSLRKSNAAADALELAVRPECREMAARAALGEPISSAEISLESQERTVYCTVWASPILTADAMPDGAVVMAADVSERRALESQMQQAQRLESLGVLAGGIAHDFNNLLTGVIGNASLLQDHFPDDSAEAEMCRSLLSAGQSMATLTSQMLAYSGRGRFVIVSIDLSRQVEQITPLLHASIPKNVQLRLGLQDLLPHVDADPGQMQQVIMNLIVNAAEAIGSEQGIVEVRTMTRRVGVEELRAPETGEPLPPGQYVALVVRDSGCGMDQQTLERIFDPFFTTKFAGRGLGLSAVLGIVRSHRGALTVESRPGEGATFCVVLPASERQPVVAEPAPASLSTGSGVVLIVDDEELVRATASAVLEKAGYEVLLAEDGEQALAVLELRRGRIDLVLLDMTMPVLSGEETLDRLLARWPRAGILATSGYDEQESRRRLGRRVAGFIHKPYNAAQLTTQVAEAMQRSRAAHS
jgi:signal transduction histidine kinase/ActR/RegA family two-component response regulator